MSLSTIGSIATHLSENYPNISAGISGNLVEIVDMARIEVQNFTGQSIGSNSIGEQFQSAILNYSKADLIDQVYAQATSFTTSGAMVSVLAGGEKHVALEGLSIGQGTDVTVSALSALGGLTRDSAKQFRAMAEQSMKYIGRKVRFGKTLV
jgi:hypothetical protein